MNLADIEDIASVYGSLNHRLAAAKLEVDMANKLSEVLGDKLNAYYKAHLAESPPPADPVDPVDPPPAVDPPSLPPAELEDYGCPADLELTSWIHREIQGAGRPSSIPVPVTGATLSGFECRPQNPGDSTDRGLLSGVADDVNLLTFRDFRTVGLGFWAANGTVTGVHFYQGSFIQTRGEHDVYVKYGGGGFGVLCASLYSHLTGSQVFQGARRQWEMSPELWSARPGPIVLKGWLAVDHARHPMEGGTGTRRSQAFKVFSQQAGTGKDDQYLEQVPTTVVFSGLRLDDSMQDSSMGGFFLGDYERITVDECEFVSGGLETHHTIDHGTGPVEIARSVFRSASGESGRGIKLRDLSRPVKIHACDGNQRIVGPNGETLSTVSEGYETPAWAARSA